MLAQRAAPTAGAIRRLLLSSHVSTRPLLAQACARQRVGGTARLFVTRSSLEPVSAATMSGTTPQTGFTLPYKDDLYNGAIVDPDGLPQDVETFKVREASRLCKERKCGTGRARLTSSTARVLRLGTPGRQPPGMEGNGQAGNLAENPHQVGRLCGPRGASCWQPRAR